VGVAAFLGECVGSLVYRFGGRVRSRVEGHLRLAFGDTKTEAEIQRITRDNLRLMGRGVLILPPLVRQGAARFRARIEVVNEHLVEEVLAEGKGAMLLASHFGLFEAAGLWVAGTGTERPSVARVRNSGRHAC